MSKKSRFQQVIIFSFFPPSGGGGGGGGGGSFFFFPLAVSEERELGASVSNQEMKRVGAHFQIESKLGEIKPRFDSPFHFLLSRPRVEDGAQIKNFIGGPM